jgi:hypothetical protein
VSGLGIFIVFISSRSLNDDVSPLTSLFARNTLKIHKVSKGYMPLHIMLDCPDQKPMPSPSNGRAAGWCSLAATAVLSGGAWWVATRVTEHVDGRQAQFDAETVAPLASYAKGKGAIGSYGIGVAASGPFVEGIYVCVNGFENGLSGGNEFHTFSKRLMRELASKLSVSIRFQADAENSDSGAVHISVLSQKNVPNTAVSPESIRHLVDAVASVLQSSNTFTTSTDQYSSLAEVTAGVSKKAD